MSYRFSEDAVTDLEEIFDYLGNHSVEAAGKLFDRIRQRAKLISRFPEAGKSYDDLIPGLKGFVVDNYIAFYIRSGEGIEILRVISGYRDLKSIFEPD
jgi:toxin ParE1/3/4